LIDPLTVAYPILDKKDRPLFHEPALAPDDPSRMNIVRRVVFERHETACEELVSQFDYLYEQNEKPHHVIFGRDFFDRFIKVDVPNMEACSFNMPDGWSDSISVYERDEAWHQMDYRRIGLFHGIRVHLIPWMSGVIVLPDLCGCRGRGSNGQHSLGIQVPVLEGLDGTPEEEIYGEVCRVLKDAVGRWAVQSPQKHVVRPARKLFRWLDWISW
jgi:hypothetical protein